MDSRQKASRSRRTTSALAVALGLAAFPLKALAHEGGDVAGGFATGFFHPLSGLDHVVAMVAVGLWGAVLQRPAIWILPVAFPVVMAFGGALGIRGVGLIGVEIGIAASAIVLGSVVALKIKAPLGVAALVVAVFAIFHGHAHGTELPQSATPLAYSAGFVLATGLLHVSGIAIGETVQWRHGETLVRGSGVAVALVGAYFLLRALT